MAILPRFPARRPEVWCGVPCAAPCMCVLVLMWSRHFVACRAAVSARFHGVAGELFKGGMYGNQGAIALSTEELLPRS